MTAPRAALVCALLVSGALAGCASDAPAGASEPLSRGSTKAGSPAEPQLDPPTPRPRGTSERWHFHDHWKGSPTITLLDVEVNLTPGQGADGLPALFAIVELPHGTIVPPETGFLTVNVTWSGAMEGLINVTYRPADSNEFHPAGDVGRVEGLVIPTTESNCDVPHRQVSAWRFNLTAHPGGTPPTMPPTLVQLRVNATIGRPLFIDPPHLDWWRGADTLPLVEAGAGSFTGASASQGGNLTAPGLPAAPAVGETPSVPQATELAAPRRVPVDAGNIVPEGAHAIVAVLNWTSQAPDAKLRLGYAEQNYPSSGFLEVAQDSPGSRVFVLKVAQAQTDTTYSNRTTWEFHVVPEGDPAAFHGDFTLVAWVTKLEPEQAVVAFRLA